MIRRVVSAILGLSSVIGPATAEEETKKRTEPYTLGEVVVTKRASNIESVTLRKIAVTKRAPKKPTRKRNTPVVSYKRIEQKDARRPAESAVPGRAPAEATAETTSIVTDEQIVQKGARSLDEAVRAVPGVVVTSGGQGIPRIMMRGLPPRQTQIFLNGVPLNSAVDGQFDPSLIPTENIDQLKIIQGPSSVLYGPGTIAGVIDIITKKGTSGVHGDVGTEIGGGSARRTYGTLSGGVENFDFFVSGSNMKRNAFVLPDGNSRSNSDSEQSNVFANFGARLGDWRLGLSVSHLSGHEGLPANTIAPGSNNPFTSGQNFERLGPIVGKSAQFDAGYEPGGPLALRFTGYINKLDVRDKRFDNANYTTMTDPTAKTFDEMIHTTVSGGQAEARYDLGAFGSITSNVAIRREAEDLSGSIRDIVLSGSGGGKGTGGGAGGGSGSKATQYGWRTLGESHDLSTTSAATEYRVDPMPRLHLTMGYSHHWFERVDTTDIGSQWMGSVGYDLTQSLLAFGTYAHKVRFPTIDQLFNPQQGNSTLRPEESDNYEAGLAWTLAPNAQLRASAFHNDVNNFILNDQINQIYVNRDVTMSGFQVSGAYSPLPNVTFRPGYTYLDMRYPSSGLPVDYRPRHVIDLLATYEPYPGWQVSSDLSYFMDQSVGSKSNAAVRQKLSNYAVVNARIQKSFANGIDVYVRATNLFNSNYEYAVGFPAAGRTVYGGIAYHF
ncbi:TonB-dependent receptor [Rhodoplanes sp. Z2-YC6860]|uniref:TonB-dependent receptor n=1 Tax=Rhodoplanes sp. Z2-YC6860 TaxID=674703 RepID=UPI00078D8757|nr:TonB-dependent receptor [Rhodoplanes sp. Z2-YC6860]AMN42250.1 TonB-dependent receptor [Rhodoplanes sp. Z2-YC6860]